MLQSNQTNKMLCYDKVNTKRKQQAMDSTPYHCFTSNMQKKTAIKQ